MSLEYEEFVELVREIQAQGFDEETASRYAGLLGDTPCYDEAGNLVVFDHGRELARLKPMQFYGLPADCEHTPEAFNELIAEIMRHGCNREQARAYAVQIHGDYCADVNGKVTAFAGGKEIAKLKPVKRDGEGVCYIEGDHESTDYEALAKLSGEELERVFASREFPIRIDLD